MKLLSKLLLVVPFLYGITVSGTTLGLEPDKNYIIHEVAHPRACVLIDSEGKTKGAAENFAHGDGANLFLVKGITVYFKSGFGYEGVWYENATGTLSTKIEVSLNEAPVDAKEHKKTAAGPNIESGSVSIPITFNEAGEFTVKSILTTTAKAADETTLAEDIDTVTTHVYVGNEAGITLAHPENGAILPPIPPPTFEWIPYEFNEFQLQLSTSADFPSQATLTLPPLRSIKGTSLQMKEWLWKIIRKWESQSGVIYWRVLGKTKDKHGTSESWHFSIE